MKQPPCPSASSDGRTYRVLTSSAELDSVRDAWERLWQRSQAEYFLSFGSTWHSWNALHRPQGAQLRCAIACAHGEILAALPMVVHRHSFWETASTCGPRSAECPDILTAQANESGPLALALLRNFLTLAHPDYLEFEFVKQGSSLEAALRGVPHLRYVRSWDEDVPYAALRSEAHWPSYLQSLGKRYQADTARCLRRLGEQGKVSFEIVSGQSTTLIDWMLTHKRRWCARTGKHGDWVFSQQYQDYLNALFASDGRYLVFALRLDGQPIAVKLMAINVSSASLIIIGYDEDFRRFSPGNVLDEHMMQYVFENYRAPDGSHLDIHLGPGVENFKLHWGRGAMTRARSYRIIASRWGWARLRAKSAIRAVRGRPATDLWDPAANAAAPPGSWAPPAQRG